MPSKRIAPLPELGDLERAALEYLWTADGADVIAVHKAIGSRRGIGVNTVGSALERLHRKKLAVREKVSHAYRYRAALKKEQFLARQIVGNAGGLKSISSRDFLASFVDVVTESEATALDELERLIAEKRREGGR